jgi:hypothetical protein
MEETSESAFYLTRDQLLCLIGMTNPPERLYEKWAFYGRPLNDRFEWNYIPLSKLSTEELADIFEELAEQPVRNPFINPKHFG